MCLKSMESMLKGTKFAFAGENVSLLFVITDSESLKKAPLKFGCEFNNLRIRCLCI